MFELVDQLYDADREIRAAAAHNLSMLGPQASSAVPHLTSLLDSTGNGYGLIMLNALHALGAIHADPEIVVPFLREYIDGPRAVWGYQVPALKALSRFKAEALEAVPAIVGLLDDPDEQIRTAAGGALSWIDPDGTARQAVE